MLLNKYFAFGSNPMQINHHFIWHDSFSKAKVASHNAMLDALSAKFNYGVCHARIACYMNIEGDGIK